MVRRSPGSDGRVCVPSTFCGDGRPGAVQVQAHRHVVLGGFALVLDFDLESQRIGGLETVVAVAGQRHAAGFGLHADQRHAVQAGYLGGAALEAVEHGHCRLLAGQRRVLEEFGLRHLDVGDFFILEHLLAGLIEELVVGDIAGQAG